VTLVDSNILLDLATDDPVWSDWSVAALEQASLNGDLIINDIVYAEISVRYARIEELDDFVTQLGLYHAAMPPAALFLAAKAFARYRKSGGDRVSVLPDFFIGAHAAILDADLLTRDAGRYRIYFPTVRLITPDIG
jgi:predicted nucleic acid-binding protein